MKLSPSLSVFTSLYVALLAAALPTERADQDSIQQDHGPKFPFYRTYHPASVNHFYTMYQGEAQNAPTIGYTLEGSAGYVLAVPGPATVALHRLWNPARFDHFYTTSEAEAAHASQHGWIREGVAGYVFDWNVTGSRPLFRLYDARNVDHFYTTDEEERDRAIRDGGYTDEGITGYILV